MSRALPIFIMTACLILGALPAQAQEIPTGQRVKRNVAAVLFASLGGAVLGLSTLPFYGEPQEHTNNISTGALLGFVGGLVFVAYDGTKPAAPTYEYSSWDELEQKRKRAFSSAEKALPVFNVSFDF